jgi:hypothetical protein
VGVKRPGKICLRIHFMQDFRYVRQGFCFFFYAVAIVAALGDNWLAIDKAR